MNGLTAFPEVPANYLATQFPAPPIPPSNEAPMLSLLPALFLLGTAAPSWTPKPLVDFVFADKSTLRAVDSTFLASSPDRRKRRLPLSSVPASRLRSATGELWLVGSAFDSGGLTYLAQKKKDGWLLRGLFHAPPHQVVRKGSSFQLAWDTLLPSGQTIRYSTRTFGGNFLTPPDSFVEIQGGRPKACVTNDPSCQHLSSAILLEGTALESRACAQSDRFPGIDCHIATSAKEIRTHVWKPMLYLYPPDTLDVSVTLDFPGKIALSYPALRHDSWQVRAFPGGDLLDPASGKRYYGLFWEGGSWRAPVSDTGFCLTREDFGTSMDSLLERKGLEFRERQEFITFWIGRITKDFVVVRFPEKAFTQAFPVRIEPAPDLFLRVFATFQQRDTPIRLTSPNLERVVRPAWTVVEWGGQELQSR